MKGTMGFINQLIRDVREKRDLTLEAAALHCDCSVSAISRWELGEREVPARYVRALFSLTRDLRLVQYIDPACQQIMVPSGSVNGKVSARTPPAGDPRDVLPKVIAATRKLTAALEYAERIVRDGLVDESDDQAILASQRSTCEVVALINAYNQAIMAWRDQAEKGRRP